MYSYSNIKSVNLEITSLCQASCPMCSRNDRGGLVNPLLKESSITLEFYKNKLLPEFIQQLESISFCGNFGDAILHQDLIDIVDYTTQSNPNIRIDIFTNGSARNTAWWQRLAKTLPTNHLVQFGIDGLGDTHSLYRVGTNFNKIIDNAKSFIEAGGKARWNFITFKHNEHQLEACKQLANKLGFDSFYEMQTSKFIGNPWADVCDKDGNVLYKLEEPSTRKITFIDKKTVENFKQVLSSTSIDCEAERNKSIYIDALGYMWPCSWIGATPYLYSVSNDLLFNYKQDSREQINKAIGNIELLDLHHTTIKDLIESNLWQTAWATNSLYTCARQCGSVVSKCSDQFLNLDTFNE